MTLFIENATIITPQAEPHHAHVCVEGKMIAAIGSELTPPAEATIIKADGLFLAPGFIDLQLNGAFGLDFTADPTTLWDVATKLPRYGVTSFLPTIITALPETRHEAQRVLLDERPFDFIGAEPLGYHFEGPFFNPQKKGAHNPAYICHPTQELVQHWSPDDGVRLVTLAPELPNALEVIATLAERGVVVSAGHSMATYAEAQAGLDAGIRYGTHLFNAMPTLHHREPGLAAALLSDPRPVVGLIADGVHVHPGMVKLAWQILGSHRLNLVTDAMAALGVPPGHYQLGSYTVTVDKTSARLPDGTLAGSILALDEAVCNLMAFTGCSFGEALPTVTTTPAHLLNLADCLGRIEPHYFADMTLFNPNLTVHTTITRGQIAYQAAEDSST